MPHMMGQNETAVSFYPPMRGKMKLSGGVLERSLFKYELLPVDFYMKILS